MTDDLIERLAALDEKRTPGEWQCDPAFPRDIQTADQSLEIAALDPLSLTGGDVPCREQQTHNAAFITILANEALPALKAAQEREATKDAEIERLRGALEGIANSKPDNSFSAGDSEADRDENHCLSGWNDAVEHFSKRARAALEGGE